MNKSQKTRLVLVALILLQYGILCSDISEKYQDIDVIFVVNVSPRLEKTRALTLQFIEEACQSVLSDRNYNFHLITYPGKNELLSIDKYDQKTFVNLIKEKLNNVGRHQRSVFPLACLNKAFFILSRGVQRRGGIIFFVSNGEHPGIATQQGDNAAPGGPIALHELRNALVSLQNIGFITYSIFLPEDTKYTRSNQANSQFMSLIAEYSDTPFFTIVETDDIKDSISILKNNIAQKNQEFKTIISLTDFAEEQSALRAELNEKNADSERALGSQNLGMMEINEKMKGQRNRLILISFLASALLFLFLFYYGKNRKKAQIEKKKNMLWGVLRPIENGKPGNPIKLNEQDGGTPINIPNGRLILHSCTKNGQRLICPHVHRGRVQCLKSSVKPSPQKYIDKETSGLEILNNRNKVIAKYDFQFLNYLKAHLKRKVHKEKEFFGRENVLNEIEANFNKRPAQRLNIIISGLPNAGKTSLLLHIQYNLFKGNPQKKSSFSIEYIGSGDTKKIDLQTLENNCELKVKNKNRNKKRTGIFLIDDYDHLYNKFGEKFIQILNDYWSKDGIYFILAGKTPSFIFESHHPEFKFIDYTIRGIDNQSNARKSIKLIDSLLNNSGSPLDLISKSLKKEIAWYASGMPFFSKCLLIKVIEHWLKDGNKISISRSDVKRAASKVALEQKMRYMKDIEKLDSNSDRKNRAKALFKDIFRSKTFRNNNGKATKDELYRDVVKLTGEDFPNETRISFNERLQDLIQMGFFEVNGNCVEGIPKLFFVNFGEENA